MRCCDWTAHEEQVAQVAAGVSDGKRCAMPFEFVVVSDSADDQLRCARTWLADNGAPVALPLWRGERYGHDRIRLA